MIAGSAAASRKAMALWAVLILLVLAMLMVSGLIFFSRSGMKQADRIVSYAEHLYRAEAVFARCLHRLRAATWEKRFYANGGSSAAFASAHESGTYREAEYHLFCQDVRGKTGKVLPGFVDVIVKIVHEGASRDYVSRVRIHCEDSGEGGDDEAVRFVRATEVLEDEAAGSGPWPVSMPRRRSARPTAPARTPWSVPSNVPSTGTAFPRPIS